MRRTTLLALLPLLAAVGALAQGPDPVIDTLVKRVALDRLHETVATLVAFDSRRFDEPGGFLAQDWIEQELLALGFTDVRLQDFDAGHDNVIAVLPGVVAPDELHVLGAHYDSINADGPGLPAPGADDNASGVAGLMEAARLIAESGLRFEATIVLVGFGSEERGRIGSAAYVDEAIANGDDIRDAVVMDVMGYFAPGTDWDISIGSSELNAETNGLGALAGSVVDAYLAGLPWEWGEACG